MGYEAHKTIHGDELGKVIAQLEKDVADLKKRVKKLEES